MKNNKTTDYFNKITSTTDLNSLSEEQINELCNELINLIPHKGHLYKYRGFKDADLFNKYCESLDQCYLYLPKASQLNDKVDTTFVYKTIRSKKEIINYYKNNRIKVFRFLYALKAKNNQDYSINLLILNNLEKGEQISRIASKLNIPGSQAMKIKYVTKVKHRVETFFDQEEYINSLAETYDKVGDELRKSFRINSLSESYDQDSMWAYYSNDNYGFCIEYDFNKIISFPTDLKRKLLCTFKIIYSNKKEPIDFIDVYDYLYGKEKPIDLFVKTNVPIMKNFITKRKSWKHELEWRIIGTLDDERIYSDLVSGIIIDESAINSEQAQRLINLATSKSWKIRIRELDNITYKFKYKRMPIKRLN